VLDTEVSDPVPGKHALDSHDDILPEGCQDMEKRFRIGSDVLVKAYLAFGIKDTDVHLFGVQIDSTIVFVLLGVKSHMASSFGLGCFLSKGILPCLRRRPSILSSHSSGSPKGRRPLQTEGPLAFLSTGWFFIGLVISAVFLGILFMNDAFNLVEKVLKKRRMEKW